MKINEKFLKEENLSNLRQEKVISSNSNIFDNMKLLQRNLTLGFNNCQLVKMTFSLNYSLITSFIHLTIIE